MSQAVVSHEEIAAEFEQRKPWYTQFQINGHIYGGERSYSADFRLKLFYKHVQERSRILELGSLEGGHSFELARAPGVSSVVALEGKAANVEKAQFVQSINGIGNVTFVQADLRTAKLWDFAHVDAIFCSGVLYHLPEPWKLIEQCAPLAPALFLWTHYCPDESAIDTVNGYRVSRFQEDLDYHLAGFQPESLWLTLGGLVELLLSSGYDEARVLRLQDTPVGPAVSLVALR